MKIRAGRKFQVLAVLALGLLPLARGDEPVLTLTAASNSVVAGGEASLWLNALNASDEKISWTFPPRIQRRIISP